MIEPHLSVVLCGKYHDNFNAVAINCIADAIINNTAVVADTGPETIITGKSRTNVEFCVTSYPSGTITVQVETE